MSRNTIQVIQVEYGVKNKVPFISSTKSDLTLLQLSCMLTETTEAEGDGIFNLTDVPHEYAFKYGDFERKFTVPSYLDANYEADLGKLINEIREWVSHLNWSKTMSFTIARKGN